jgi:hypothetical protein
MISSPHLILGQSVSHIHRKWMTYDSNNKGKMVYIKHAKAKTNMDSGPEYVS